MERGLSAKEAAIKAISEVSGPVVATTLVLLAVFVPTAFLPGITGEMYRQFALTIAVSTVFSSINALTMSPALCALLLRPPKAQKNAFFRGFDAVFRKVEGAYVGMVRSFVRRTFIVMLLAIGIGGFTAWQFVKVPTGFLPIEDQGVVLLNVQSWARLMSTISINLVEPGKLRSRSITRFASSPRTSAGSRCATLKGRWCRWALW
jgi:multidrug efflux pump subunit AcrB